MSEILDELRYKEEVKKLSQDEKMNYLIDKSYDNSLSIADMKLNCKACQDTSYSKKQTLTVASIVAVINTVIAVITGKTLA